MKAINRAGYLKQFKTLAESANKALELAGIYLEDGALLTAAEKYQKAAGLLVRAQRARQAAMALKS